MATIEVVTPDFATTGNTPESVLVLERNFDLGTNGQPASGSDAFNSAFDSVYSTDQAVDGTQSGKCTIVSGATGFGEWGGIINLPEQYSQGTDLWVKASYYYPSAFAWNSPSGVGVKTLRVRQFDVLDQHKGYFDIYVDQTDLSVINEAKNAIWAATFPSWKDLGGVTPKDQWVTLEMYIKLHATNGSAIFRVWQDGVLVFDDDTIATLTASDSYVSQIYIWTYWNGGSPQDNTAYVDAVKVATQTPAGRDAAGNPMIGPEGWVNP